MEITGKAVAREPVKPAMMDFSRFDSLHEWNIPPESACQVQRELGVRVRLGLQNSIPIKTVTGVDVRYHKDTAYAAAVTLSLPALKVLETRKAESRIAYPYISGLLAFREIPALLPVLQKLQRIPDAIIADGHGTAHPRRFGLACHLGILLELPVIGCARKRLWGSHEPTGNSPGSLSWIEDQGQQIGAVLRTRRRVAPVFISPGHGIDLDGAITLVKSCLQGFRIPEPLRLAGILTR